MCLCLADTEESEENTTGDVVLTVTNTTEGAQRRCLLWCRR